MATPPHIIFAGGMTGGHLFPGIAVAEQLTALPRRPQITFAGSGNRFERRHVARAGFGYFAIACHPLGGSPWKTLRFVADQVAAYHAAVRFLRRQRGSLVVGLGGYCSVPMARAALHLGIPLVLLEQNTFPGRATRWLAPRASLICLGFEVARRHLEASCPVRVTGIPVRSQFGALEHTRATGRGPIENRENGEKHSARSLHSSRRRHRLLVLGGSQGAESLNQAVPRALHKLRHNLGAWEIVHQAGEGKAAAARELYKKLALPARVVSFIDDVASVLAGTDLAISRAGGSALAELSVAGVPAVLVPYPHATDDHQRRNADLMARRGAARIVDPRVLSDRLDNLLAESLAGLLIDPWQRQLMAHAMRRQARPDAAWTVAQMVAELAGTAHFRAA